MTVSMFFFQAEDGIRDSSVTGVQTCALPIFFSPKRPCRRKRSCRHSRRRRSNAKQRSCWRLRQDTRRAARRRPTFALSTRRSEERRVGKSVDLGGRRIIKKKKNSDEG